MKIGVSLIGKWSWVCFAFDATNIETSKAWINGRALEGVYTGPPKNSVPSQSKYSIVLAKYRTDGRPTLGEFLDIQAWDRFLTDADMEKGTNCKLDSTFLEGNLINSKTQWIVNSSLVDRTVRNISEIGCKERNVNVDLLVPGKWFTFEDAKEACKKLNSNGMAFSFDDRENYEILYKEINSFSGFVNECWHGGRILTWLPFQSSNCDNSTTKASEYKNYHTRAHSPDVWMNNHPKVRKGNDKKKRTFVIDM